MALTVNGGWDAKSIKKMVFHALREDRLRLLLRQALAEHPPAIVDDLVRAVVDGMVAKDGVIEILGRTSGKWQDVLELARRELLTGRAALDPKVSYEVRVWGAGHQVTVTVAPNGLASEVEIVIGWGEHSGVGSLALLLSPFGVPDLDDGTLTRCTSGDVRAFEFDGVRVPHAVYLSLRGS